MNNIDEEIKRLGLSASEWSIFLKYDARVGRNLIGIAIERHGLTVAAWTGEDAQIDACAARDAILESLAIAWLRGHASARADLADPGVAGTHTAIIRPHTIAGAPFVVTGGGTIVGCACGWRPTPSGVIDVDHQYVEHIAAAIGTEDICACGRARSSRRPRTRRPQRPSVRAT